MGGRGREREQLNIVSGAGIPARQLNKNEQFEQALLPPAPDVLPWEDYQESVSAKVQKSLGHQKVIVNGKTVVIMPAPKGTPWKLQQKYAAQLNHQEFLHAQNSDDSEDECLDKFEDMAKECEEQVAQVTSKASTLQEMLEAVKAAESSNAGVGAGAVWRTRN